MTIDFDRIIDRRDTECEKWGLYGDDVLPLWVADMDFPAPEPVLRALSDRVSHGVLGYACEPRELRAALVAWLADRYGWRVAPEAVVPMPGVVSGFNVACRTFARAGAGILVQTPVYPPMLAAPGNLGLERHEMELTCGPGGSYTVDDALMERSLRDGTALFMLCNPQNPTGRAFTSAELGRMAEICLRREIAICSDEIHCDLVYRGHRHVPIASLAPEVARRTITLMAPSKTFNIPGLGFSFAVIEDRELRREFKAAASGIVPHPTALGYVGALAAYAEGAPWLEACLRYLEGNRDFVCETVARELPGVRVSRPEATYLAWLDCRDAGIPTNPHRFFLERARVAMNDGATFGRGGEGFVRLNFGCPRATLAGALERMAAALRSL